MLGRPRPPNRSVDLNRPFRSDGLGAPGGGASQQDKDEMPFRVTTGRQDKIGRLPHHQCAFELATRCQCHLYTCWTGPRTSFVLPMLYVHNLGLDSSWLKCAHAFPCEGQLSKLFGNTSQTKYVILAVLY